MRWVSRKERRKLHRMRLEKEAIIRSAIVTAIVCYELPKKETFLFDLVKGRNEIVNEFQKKVRLCEASATWWSEMRVDKLTIPQFDIRYLNHRELGALLRRDGRWQVAAKALRLEVIQAAREAAEHELVRRRTRAKQNWAACGRLKESES